MLDTTMLDPDVYVLEMVKQEESRQSIKKYNAILAFDMAASVIRTLDDLCSSLNVPLCACTSRGVSGWIFINPQRHEYIVETSIEDEKTGEVKKQVVEKAVVGTSFSSVAQELESMIRENIQGKGRRRKMSVAFDAITACIEFELEHGRGVAKGDYGGVQDLLQSLRGSKEVGDSTTGMTAAALESYIDGECVPPVLAILGGLLANEVIKIVSRKGELGIDRVCMYSILDDAAWIL
jgi:hypothetical protein